MLLLVGIEIITVLAVNGATGGERGISEMGPAAAGSIGTDR